MAVCAIEPAVFEMFPIFRRGVIVATGIDNQGENPETPRLLAEAVSRVGVSPDATEEERISLWNAAYLKFGANPKRYTPSIRFLYEQIHKGKPPRSISKAVDIMNATSIKWVMPCGGDDLDSLEGGDLLLGIARGDETFAPLFKPDGVEHPDAGEIIYYVPQTKRVMCRRWTWRNADFSKVTPETKSLLLNFNMMMPPFTDADMETALNELATQIQQICGGTTKTGVLSPSNPAITID
jgi:DNA/RNA-binding domain of Phe-tRNA-synthetase-like protein